MENQWEAYAVLGGWGTRKRGSPRGTLACVCGSMTCEFGFQSRPLSRTAGWPFEGRTQFLLLHVRPSLQRHLDG